MLVASVCAAWRECDVKAVGVAYASGTEFARSRSTCVAAESRLGSGGRAQDEDAGARVTKRKMSAGVIATLTD